MYKEIAVYKDSLHNQVAEFVGLKTGVTNIELKSRSRKSRIADAKTLFCKVCYINNDSYSSMSDYLGIDHATAIYHVEKKSVDLENTAVLFKIKRTKEEIEYRKLADNATETSVKVRSVFPIRYDMIYLYEKYGFRCAIPDCYRDDVLEVHHIVPRSSGGSNSESNLIVLCPTHHALADRGMVFLKE